MQSDVQHDLNNNPLTQYLHQEREAEKLASHFTPSLKKKPAFTLAEVLITLGIIGIVAALTMPSLMANYRKKVYVTQLKRVVNVLSNNFKYILANENIDDLCNSSVVVSCKDTDISFPGIPSIVSISIDIDQEKYAKFFNLTEVSENTKFKQSLNDISVYQLIMWAIFWRMVLLFLLLVILHQGLYIQMLMAKRLQMYGV